MSLEGLTLFFGYFAVVIGVWGLIRPDHFKFLLQWRFFGKIRFMLFFLILFIGWTVFCKIANFESFRIKLAGLIISVVVVNLLFAFQKKMLDSAIQRFSSWPLSVFRILSFINLLLGIFLIKK